MSTFIAGRDLNRRFYLEVVLPLLNTSFPQLNYAAALLGPGSETLGLDSEMSMDHDWGLHFFLFLQEQDAHLGNTIANILSQQLPSTFLDIPVSFPVEPIEPRTRIMKRPTDGPINHRIIPITVRNFVRIQLGFDLAQPLEAADWLTFPSHALGEIVAGEVYHDATGELSALRSQLSWYPRDIWLYLLAAGWQRIGQEEHLMPRAGYMNDELGSALIGSRLVRDVMRLGFLMEKRYAPYAKWFGTAFTRLHCAQSLGPILWRAQQASSWKEREEALCRAYEQLAHMHNALGLTQKLPETVSPFFERPFQVIHGELFAQALLKQISDPAVQRIARQRLIGNIDQWSDNTDIEGLERAKLRSLYS
ncbi:DUF4037 domain-containing protein [Ktedonosporobacter rubrisoli]|uniref:DUF4037 domain-containing protein n=1 Tax=Ktedonosporobacter rubrisoli TaxID=2509675 RepID=A0A4P6JJD1_KTERU|nr:DUF4037 domain-containing protein [Ktedonosporobacter rubrisoli]QBD75227.1 DUF4037 domain-containing protein [Ktedonosporobacter rubrisoli]